MLLYLLHQTEYLQIFSSYSYSFSNISQIHIHWIVVAFSYIDVQLKCFSRTLLLVPCTILGINAAGTTHLLFKRSLHWTRQPIAGQAGESEAFGTGAIGLITGKYVLLHIP